MPIYNSIIKKLLDDINRGRGEEKVERRMNCDREVVIRGKKQRIPRRRICWTRPIRVRLLGVCIKSRVE